jgi:MFS family permease
LRNFGGLFGGLVAALSLGTAFGPLAAGATFDRFGSYAPFLVLTMVLMGVSSLALASLRLPPDWAVTNTLGRAATSTDRSA